MPGPTELIIILLIALLLFGTSKLPRLARSIGESSKEFKEGLKQGYVPPVEGPCPFCSTHVPAESKFCPGCSKSADEIVAERERKTSKSA